MGDIVLFSPFGFVSASCCLSVSHDARITHMRERLFLVLGLKALPSAQQSARNKPQPTTNREQLQACLALPRCEGGRQKSKSQEMNL